MVGVDRRETERLLEAIRQASAAGEPAAMATVVRVRGSAYRREGTRMFVRRNGTYECALSGGCLEYARTMTVSWWHRWSRIRQAIRNTSTVRA